ncbi:hypothetical protein LguiB_032712 [Lonicera macranthoides]
MGYCIPRNKLDGSFTSDLVAKSLRLVMVEEGGKVYKDKVKEVRVLFGDRDRQDKALIPLEGQIKGVHKRETKKHEGAVVTTRYANTVTPHILPCGKEKWSFQESNRGGGGSEATTFASLVHPVAEFARGVCNLRWSFAGTDSPVSNIFFESDCSGLSRVRVS